MSYNRLKSLAANVAAIETAVTVHKQRRKATQEEKQVLAQYSGFGGVKEVLTIGTQIPMPEELAELRPADEQYKGFRADCVLYAGFPH